MIYHAYYEGFRIYGNPKLVKSFQTQVEFSMESIFSELLEKRADTIIFIVTKDQYHAFRAWAEGKGLYAYLHYEMPDFVRNHNYYNEGPKLELVIFKGKGKNEEV